MTSPARELITDSPCTDVVMTNSPAYEQIIYYLATRQANTDIEYVTNLIGWPARQRAVFVGLEVPSEFSTRIKLKVLAANLVKIPHLLLCEWDDSCERFVHCFNDHLDFPTLASCPYRPEDLPPLKPLEWIVKVRPHVPPPSNHKDEHPASSV